MKILVIDDDPQRQYWFRDALSTVAHQVDSASNVTEALARLRQLVYDLAFFDHDLGDDSADGSQLASEILWNKELYHWPRHVVVQSLNPHGAENIASKFRSVSVPVTTCDFAALIVSPQGLRDFVQQLALSLR